MLLAPLPATALTPAHRLQMATKAGVFDAATAALEGLNGPGQPRAGRTGRAMDSVTIEWVAEEMAETNKRHDARLKAEKAPARPTAKELAGADACVDALLSGSNIGNAQTARAFVFLDVVQQKEVVRRLLAAGDPGGKKEGVVPGKRQQKLKGAPDVEVNAYTADETRYIILCVDGITKFQQTWKTRYVLPDLILFCLETLQT